MLTNTPEAVIGQGVQPIASAAEITLPDTLLQEKPPLVAIKVRLAGVSTADLPTGSDRLSTVGLDTLSRGIVGSKGSERIRRRRGRRPRCLNCHRKQHAAAGECKGGGLPGSNPPIYVPFKIAA